VVSAHVSLSDRKPAQLSGTVRENDSLVGGRHVGRRGLGVPADDLLFQIGTMPWRDVHEDMNMLAGAIAIALPRPRRYEIEAVLPRVDTKLVAEARRELAACLLVEVLERSEGDHHIEWSVDAPSVLPPVRHLVDLISGEAVRGAAAVHGRSDGGSRFKGGGLRPAGALPPAPQLSKETGGSVFAQFGPVPSDIQQITGWLQGHGFSVNTVYPSGMTIDFSGTAGQVAAAFHTAIHYLDVGGVTHFANMSDPQIPAALAPAVVGVVSLHNFRSRAHKADCRLSQARACPDQCVLWIRPGHPCSPTLASAELRI
jgi:hypothetical protein